MPHDRPWERKPEKEGNLTRIFPGRFNQSGGGPGSGNIFLESAIRYAQLGWSVLPLHNIIDGRCTCAAGEGCGKNSGKHPRTAHGVNDATTDLATIRGWWTTWPSANIGIACGEKSGIVVMDVDPRNGGNETMEELAQYGDIPDGVMAFTGGGGEHHVFAYQPGAKFPRLKGIDIQGDGKYFVVEPSNHIQGSSYAWEGSSDPLEGVKPAPIPQWLLDFKSEKTAPSVPQQQIVEYAHPQEVADVRSALNFMRSDDRAEWIRFGANLKPWGELGREIWITWSQMSPAWQPDDAQEWDTIQSDHGHPIAIIKEAQARGWVNPMAKIPGASQPDIAIELIKATEYAQHIKATEWLIKGYLETDCLTQLFGKPAAGKSFLAIDWALSIASGRPWNGAKTKKMAVIYIAGEGQNGIAKRIHAWCKAHDMEIPELAFFTIEALGLLNINTAQKLCDAIEEIVASNEYQVGAIFIDTLARNFGDGNESATEDMNQFIDHCDKFLRQPFGANVVIVHHAGHAHEGRARGSSALPAAVSADYKLQIDRSENVGGIVTLSNQKMKDGPEPENVQMYLDIVDLGIRDEDEEPVTSCALRPVVIDLSSIKGVGEKQRQVCSCLDQLLDERGTDQVTESALRKRLVDAGVYDRKSTTSMAKSIDALCDRGILVRKHENLSKGNNYNAL